MADGMKYVEAISQPKDVPGALTVIGSLTHALTSEAELKAALKKKLKELNIVWDKAAKAYVQKEEKTDD